MTDHPTSSVDFYKDDSGQWRWRVKSANGEIISTSSEAYADKRDAEHGFDLTVSADERTARPMPPEPDAA